MKISVKKITFLLAFFSLSLVFAQESELNSESNVSVGVERASSTADEDSLASHITDAQAHRFLEFRGAIPVFPAFTSHGLAQSFVVGFADIFGTVFTPGDNYDNTQPKLATDLNVTFFMPFTDYRLGFMGGAAIDMWESSRTVNSKSEKETMSMNFYYLGAHFDYGHWVFSEIGTRLSIYGELSIGWMEYKDDDDSDLSFCFDVCPFGIQFCPEKHIGLYIELPHIGARPFFQTGISIGL